MKWIAECTAPPDHHDLVELSSKAKQKLSSAERELLKRLTTFVVWAGRYPVATTAKKSQAPRHLKSTDYATIATVAGRLHKAHLQGHQ